MFGILLPLLPIKNTYINAPNSIMLTPLIRVYLQGTLPEVLEKFATTDEGATKIPLQGYVLCHDHSKPSSNGFVHCPFPSLFN